MRRTILLSTAFLLGFALAAPAQDAGVDADERIRSALSAAPQSVAEHATVADLDGTLLREGTNGWVCLPDDANMVNNAPMCLDAAWREFMDAYMNRRQPRFEGIGIGYMLQGDFPVSNTDPYATGPTTDNEWLVDGGPHIMMIISDAELMAELPTDPHNGGPWVMWKGTPYAHVMIPTVARPR